MNYYSDNGVDVEIEKLLPDFGYAVEIGASNGLFASNALHFEEKGWLVLCVEANPLLADEGRTRRKLWRSVAAGKENADNKRFCGYGPYPWGSGSALYPPTQSYVDGGAMGGEMTVDLEVPVRTLDTILEEAGFPRVDLVTIDVEGYENDVMAGFSLERWKPKIMVIESLLDNFATPYGYGLHRRMTFDNIYLRV